MPDTVTAPDAITLPVAGAIDLLQRAFTANQVSEHNARLVAQALVAAEIDGQAGHGFSRVTSYAAQAKSGKVDGFATPAMTQMRPSLIAVDANHGFAYPAIDCTIDALAPLTLSQGMAGASIRHSHHCGQLSAHVERLAEHGLIGIMVANTPKAMAPWGGSKPVFGTNPIAFSAPRADGPPLLIDLSLSKVARGKIMAASKTGAPIPEGWALDAQGEPTTDAKAALGGTMIPMGDAKGAALALMVEVLASSLTGANRSDQASSFFDADGPSPGVGQFIIAIQPDHGFADRFSALAALIETQDGARLPGSSRTKARATAARQGIKVARHLIDEISALADG